MLPMNGRIAIVDDKFEQIKFLVDDFSRHQIPFRYYDGQMDSLPDLNQPCNDIRLLIMDLNLIDDTKLSDKNLMSSLFPILIRLVPEENYPYVLVYWSRHQDDHADFIENKLFMVEELSNRRPIAFIDAAKSDFYDLDGKPKKNITSELVKKIDHELSLLPAYQILLNWENDVHEAADNTIQKIFKFDSNNNWSAFALNLLSRFAKAEVGSENLKTLNAQEQVNSALSVLGLVLNDSLLLQNGSAKKNTFPELVNVEEVDIKPSSINTTLLIDVRVGQSILPGSVTKKMPSDDSNLGAFTNDIFDRDAICKHCEETYENWSSLSTSQKKNKIGEKRNILREQAFLIDVNVDPLCDYAQKKVKFSRTITGVMLSEVAREFIDNRSEANFISPVFEYESRNYFFVLNYKYLNTLSSNPRSETTSQQTIFKLRQQVLVEVQSKLARHVNRQGILFLE